MESMIDNSSFKTEYKINMPLSGIAVSWFSRGKDEKFAYLDYEVEKGMKWSMKFYSDEAKSDLVMEANQQKLSFLAGQSGYVFKDAKSGEELGTWVPQKRFLNIFLRAPYKLMVGEKEVATSPGEGFFKLLVPGAMRKLISRKVILSADKKQIAAISAQSVLGCGVVKVKPAGGAIEDAKMATAVAVLAAICGLQDV